MQQYTDQQYYSRFERQEREWSSTVSYPLGWVVYTPSTDQFWASTTADNIGSDPLADPRVGWDPFTPPQVGEGQFITLEDIVNNFMVGYSDDMLHGGEKMRHKVEFFAQRAVQEFSYDVFTLKSQEWTPTPTGVPLWPMPQDFVSLVQVSYTDEGGIERRLRPRLDSTNPRSLVQDNQGNRMYDSNGKLTTTTNSMTTDRWNTRRENSSPYVIYGSGFSYFNSAFNGYGGKYWIDPEVANINGTYLVNNDQGTVSIDMDLRSFVSPGSQSPLLVFHYVSDGLSNDLSEIKVHKFAEQAIYETIYAELVDKRRDVPANEKQKARRKARAMQHNAKIRLQDQGHRELIYTFRAKTQWIKT